MAVAPSLAALLEQKLDGYQDMDLTLSLYLGGSEVGAVELTGRL